MNLNKLLAKFEIELSEVKEMSLRYFISDLHFVPFKEVFEKSSNELKDYLYNEIIKINLENDKNKIPWEDLSVDEDEYIYSEFLQAFYSDKINPNVLIDLTLLLGAYSFTRSVNYLDASRIFDRWHEEDWSIFNCLLKVYKQIPLSKEDLPFRKIGDSNFFNPVKIKSVENIEIALTSYKVLISSWESKVNNLPEPDITRLPRLYNLINTILGRKPNCVDIIVLPELAINDFSLRLISELLRNSNIALITGLDYEIDWKNKTVRNRLAYVIPIEKFGRKLHLQLIQDKEIGAIHEINDLWNKSKLKLIAKNRNKYLVKHKNSILSSLICNEFLNIDYRQKLRGEIDLLVLLEWNQDINTYNSLVEANANDLHCFVVQVNNRLYGDTRVRAPFRLEYKRDIARIRGGEDDYCVIAKINVSDLRLFQMNNISPTDNQAIYKPVPTGYEMKNNRRLK
ncbi:hypothetical protein PZ892_10585 [Sphingobacterium sp. WM]|uniref:hypothetical protein n=1 Tax=Sphingobacterium sp. WM TaxID=3031802 RepID=UPI00240D4334|nr:hypothetical protein [Sphingobacterium sp. WM]WFB62127.1 hypothetical protein PZ892_10585 [Sphingobacterium sp. WM]